MKYKTVEEITLNTFIAGTFIYGLELTGIIALLGGVAGILLVRGLLSLLKLATGE